MSTEAWPAGVDLVILDEVDSTNAEALRRAPALRRPSWIMARRQTAGRGRRGRAWLGAEGNLAASLALPLGAPADAAALRSFVAALALYDALSDVTGRADAFALKWPNDCLANGRKIAGILLEGAGRGGRLDHLVIGIGVNLAAAPPASALEPGATAPLSLAEAFGLAVTPDEFLPFLARAFQHREEAFRRSGFAPIRDAWLSRAARLGTEVVARLPGTEIRGVFETVDASGAIVLNTPTGQRKLAAADIFF